MLLTAVKAKLAPYLWLGIGLAFAALAIYAGWQTIKVYKLQTQIAEEHKAHEEDKNKKLTEQREALDKVILAERERRITTENRNRALLKQAQEAKDALHLMSATLWGVINGMLDDAREQHRRIRDSHPRLYAGRTAPTEQEIEALEPINQNAAVILVEYKSWCEGNAQQISDIASLQEAQQ